MKIEVLQVDRWKELNGIKEWSDLIELGWVFKGVTKEGNIIMTRDGYINEFRNKPQEVRE